jgi:diguanylate cyclase (GGDEF)-like protein
MAHGLNLTPLPQSNALLNALDAKTLQHARDVLERQLWFFSIPDALKTAFLFNRQDQFFRLAQAWLPLLFLMVILEVVVGIAFCHADLKGWSATLWFAHLGLCLLMCALTTWLSKQPRFLQNYLWWLSAAVVVCLSSKLYIALILPPSPLADYQLVISLTITMVSMLAIRLPIIWSVSAAVLSIGMASALAGLTHQIANFYIYSVMLMYVGMCTFVAFLADRQEKLHFLQMILLNYESKQRDELNQQLLYLSQTDGLTGLSNRRHFEQRFEHEWQRARRHQHQLAIVMIDIDHFKLYNDHYGHLAGDECLRQVAQLIRGVLGRPADVAARFGGEEFVLLLPHTDAAGAYEVATRMMKAIDQAQIRHDYGSAQGYVSVSIGVASRHPHHLEQAQHLIDLADAALYQAKHQGRHQICLSCELSHATLE